MSQNQALRYVVAAANAGNVALAKSHLQKAAETAPDDAAVWLWMGWFADSPLSAIHCLETALQDERYRELATAGLAWCRAMATFRGDVPTPNTSALNTSTALAVPSSEGVVAKAIVAESPSSSDVDLVEKIAAVRDEVAATVTPANRTEDEVTSTPATSVELADAPTFAEAAPIAAPTFAEPTALSNETSHWGATQQIIQPSVNDAPIHVSPRPTSERSIDSFDWDRSVHPSAAVTSFAAPAAESVDSRIVEFETTDPEVLAPETSEPESPEAPVAETSASATPTSMFTDATPRSSHFETKLTSYSSSSSNEPSGIWRAAQDDWFSPKAATVEDQHVAPSAPDWATSRVDEPITQAAAVSVQQPVPTESHVSEPTVAPLVFADDDEVLDEAHNARHEAAVIAAAPDAEGRESVQMSEPAPLAQEPVAFTTEVVSAPVSVETPAPVEHRSISEEVIETECVAVEAEPVVVPEAVSEPEPEVEPPAGVRESSAASSATKTVLVVDDSPTVRKLVAMTLEKRGFVVVSAFDGVAAIKEIATHNPDLILMDVNMPRLDGYQLCKLVKKHETTRHIPVVMLSGKDGMFDRLRGRLVGCSGYISKPFIPEDLVASVEEHLAAAATV